MKPKMAALNDCRPVALTSVVMKALEPLALTSVVMKVLEPLALRSVVMKVWEPLAPKQPLKSFTGDLLGPLWLAYCEKLLVDDAVALVLFFILRHLTLPIATLALSLWTSVFNFNLNVCLSLGSSVTADRPQSVNLQKFHSPRSS